MPMAWATTAAATPHGPRRGARLEVEPVLVGLAGGAAGGGRAAPTHEHLGRLSCRRCPDGHRQPARGAGRAHARSVPGGRGRRARQGGRHGGEWKTGARCASRKQVVLQVLYLTKEESCTGRPSGAVPSPGLMATVVQAGRHHRLWQQFAWPEALQSLLFALQWTILAMFSTNVTIFHHLISQAGWNRCNLLSIYLSIYLGLDSLTYSFVHVSIDS